MNYEETLSYIHKVSWTGSRPGLERIEELLELLGNPQKQLRFIHVAGTNGKGSFCAMCDSVLRKAGYKTGLYTSPYIERFNERITIQGNPISDDELAEITTYVKGFADTMADPPTEFELITAVAMVAFSKNQCDPVVLEVGMGGRLDATNVIEHPLLSVITGISLDHTAFLGDTVEKIAFEKAGIIKDGVPILYGGENEIAAAVIKQRADEKNAEFFRTPRNELKIERLSFEGTDFSFAEQTYHIGLLGTYQPYNAANVIAAVEILGRRGLVIGEADLQEGLAEAEWKGRFEMLSKDPIFVIDGSHNPEGIAAAVEGIRMLFDEKVILLSGVMADKDYADMAETLSSVALCAVTLKPNNPRALAAELYAAEFRKNEVEAEGFDCVDDAVKRAVCLAAERKRPVVALGSLYMYGEVKSALLKTKK